MEQEQLEHEFERVFNEINPQIQEKLAAAVELINEAEELAEKHGIPFRPKDDIMFCTPSYVPYSFQEKFPDLDFDFYSELTGAYSSDGYAGWQMSQTC